MIVKVTFDEDHVMVFGSSYKAWYQQLFEYMCLQSLGKVFEGYECLRIEQSKSKWPGFGGLKWCAADELAAIVKDRDGRDARRFRFKPASERTIQLAAKIGLTVTVTT